MTLQTMQYLALQVKDGNQAEWQMALCDLALLNDKISPSALEFNFHFQTTSILQ